VLAAVPAAAVPVAAEVGRETGHGHDVSGAGGDVVAATRAEVGLVRLVGLHTTDLDLLVVERPGHGGAFDERARVDRVVPR
jgi:hypothetical protein